MNKGIALMGGAALGAAVMYMMDPAMGRRRRAFAGDKVLHFWRKTCGTADALTRDLRNRAMGTAEGIKSRFRAGLVSDDVLVERVRSKMGRSISHPGAITVTANEGCVRLSGPILRDEVDDLISCVNNVNGVREVQNDLQLHDTPEDSPMLQGGSIRPYRSLRRMPRAWVMLGATGGALAAYGIVRRGNGGHRSKLGRLITPVQDWWQPHTYKRAMHLFR